MAFHAGYPIPVRPADPICNLFIRMSSSDVTTRLDSTHQEENWKQKKQQQT